MYFLYPKLKLIYSCRENTDKNTRLLCWGFLKALLRYRSRNEGYPQYNL